MLKKPSNPLTSTSTPPAVDLTRLTSRSIYRRQRPSKKRELRDLRRQKHAANAIAGFDHETEIFGFTKGQFSIIDLLRALLDITGPSDLLVSTWTAANTDVTTVLDFVDAGIIHSARWLVDLTFQRRSPELAARIRSVFGPDAIRVAKNHAKFAILTNADWSVVIRTSMNLNFNPRFEDFTIADDPDLADFILSIINEVWSVQKRDLADARPYDIHKFFDNQM